MNPPRCLSATPRPFEARGGFIIERFFWLVHLTPTWPTITKSPHFPAYPPISCSHTSCAVWRQSAQLLSIIPVSLSRKFQCVKTDFMFV